MKKAIFYLSILIVFALPAYLVRFDILGIPTTLLEILIYISFLLTVILYISDMRHATCDKNKSKPMLHVTCYLLPVILFIIAGIIGIVVAQDKQTALGQFKAYIVDPILFFFVLIINFKNWKTSTPLNLYTFKPVFQALILGGTLVAIHAIWQKATGQVAIDGRVIGVFGYSPNYLSLYLAPIAVLTFGYGILNYNKKSPSTPLYLYTFIPISLLLIAIYFSGSRAGLAVTIVSISILLILRWWNQIRQSRILTLLLYFFIALLLIAGWWFIKPNFSLSQDQGGRITSSNNVRWQIWDTSVKMLSENNKWLSGVGLGNYQEYFSQFSKGWVNFDEYISPNALTAHNLYLQTWFNLGLLGIIAFIWLIILFFRYAISNMRYAKNIQTQTTYYILLATMFSILLYGILETTYWKNDLAVMFWLILAFSFVTNKTNLTNKSN